MIPEIIPMLKHISFHSTADTSARLPTLFPSEPMQFSTSGDRRPTALNSAPSSPRPLTLHGAVNGSGVDLDVTVEPRAGLAAAMGKLTRAGNRKPKNR